MPTPRLLYIRSTGVEVRPIPISTLLIRPVEPNSSAQPSVRTTTEIKSGPSTTIRNKPFHGLAMRDKTYASAVPRIRQATVTAAATPNVRA
ncbi:hypothetical protein D3C85_1637520 [compost metagenome]